MTWRPLSSHDLPPVSTSPASTSRFGPVRRALLGKTAALRSSPLGATKLRCADVVVPRRPDDSDAVWTLSRPDQEAVAYLLMEGMTALRIVAATLGIPTPRVLRPLGASERGIVTAALATALRGLRSDITVDLRRPSWSDSGLVRLIISAEFPSFRERFRVDLRPEWLPADNQPHWLIDAARQRLEVPFAVELARTILTARDWAGARAGDVVVFDNQPAVVADDERQVWLVSGAFACQAALSPEGIARIETEFQSGWKPIRAPGDQITIADDKNGETMAIESPEVALTMVASAPIEVVAEIGRIVMRADEVIALRPGTVLPLGPLSSSSVSLKVGDRTWAQGELVSVDGELGVRLTTVTGTSTAVPPPAGSDEQDTRR